MAVHFQFWTVWNPEGGPSTVKHSTREIAVAEAERLAANHRGKAFFVMQCIGVAEVVKPAVFVPFSHYGDTPF